MLAEILYLGSAVVTSGHITVCTITHRPLLRPWVKNPLSRPESGESGVDGSGNNIKQGPSKDLAVPGSDKPVYELFDHPAPPIPLLGASLPTAPMGFGWEITTPSVAGDPVLRVTLLNLATSTEVESIEGNLLVARRWKYANDETYSDLYHRATHKVVAAWERNRQENIRWDHNFNGLVYRPDLPMPADEIEQIKGKVMMANLITPMVDWARQITLRYIVEHPDESKVNYMLIESPIEDKESVLV